MYSYHLPSNTYLSFFYNQSITVVSMQLHFTLCVPFWFYLLAGRYHWCEDIAKTNHMEKYSSARTG